MSLSLRSEEERTRTTQVNLDDLGLRYEIVLGQDILCPLGIPYEPGKYSHTRKRSDDATYEQYVCSRERTKKKCQNQNDHPSRLENNKGKGMNLAKHYQGRLRVEVLHTGLPIRRRFRVTIRIDGQSDRSSRVGSIVGERLVLLDGVVQQPVDLVHTGRGTHERGDAGGGYAPEAPQRGGQAEEVVGGGEEEEEEESQREEREEHASAEAATA